MGQDVGPVTLPQEEGGGRVAYSRGEGTRSPYALRPLLKRLYACILSCLNNFPSSSEAAGVTFQQRPARESFVWTMASC